MYKLLLISIVTISFSASAALNWAFTGETMGSEFEDGWLIRMYQDIGSDTDLSVDIFNDWDVIGNDIFTGIETVVQADDVGSYFERYNIETEGSIDVYTVIFNASSFLESTEYIICDSSPVSLAAADSINNVNYKFDAIDGAWQAVPEPTTMALLGLSGLIAFLVRCKQHIA